MAQYMTTAEFQRWREIIEVLAGMRGEATKHALRQGTIANLQELISGLRTSAGSLSTSLKGISDAVAAAEGSIVGTQENINDLQQHAGRLDGDISGLSQQLQAALNQLGQLNRELDAAEQSIAATTQQAQQTASALQEIRIGAVSVSVPTQQSGQISGAPTAADFNKLVADIGGALSAIAQLKSAVD